MLVKLVNGTSTQERSPLADLVPEQGGKPWSHRGKPQALIHPFGTPLQVQCIRPLAYVQNSQRRPSESRWCSPGDYTAGRARRSW